MPRGPRQPHNLQPTTRSQASHVAASAAHFFLFFLCTDVITGVLASGVDDGHSRIILGLLIIIHMVQISALPSIVKVLGVTLPETIMWVVFGLVRWGSWMYARSVRGGSRIIHHFA
jgi:hypothetical membrane protein